VGEYRRISKREVYRNRWIVVEAHDIVHPTGVAGEHVLVLTGPPVAILVDDDGDLLFAKQPRFGAQADLVELVKGGADEGESPLECAQRELREELGVVAGSWEELGQVHEIPSIIAYPVTLFLATAVEHVIDDQEENERIELVRLPAERAIAAAAAGRLTDAVTATALLRYGVRTGRLTLHDR
jgi:ADP-ribose pyrophosphatase